MHLPTLSKAKALDNLQQPSVDGARHRRNPKTCKLMVLQNFIGPFLVFAPWFSSLNLTEVPLTSYSISNIPYLSLSVQHNIVIFWKINKRTNSSFRHKKTSSPTQVVSKTESLSLLCQRSQEGGDPNPNLNRRIGHLLEILRSDPALWTPLKITLGDKVAVSKIGWYQFDISYGCYTYSYSFPLTHVLQLLEVHGVVRQKSGRLNPHKKNRW